MRFKLRYLILLCIFILPGCKSDDNGPPPPQLPSAAVLVFPDENSECTTGIDLGNGTSEITFVWQASDNTDLYTLTVVNLNTNTPQTIATTGLSATFALTKGAPFSWSVTSTKDDLTAVSENWLFYNAGPQLNYAPFPAQIISPESGQTVQNNSDGEIVLAWSGADVENEIERYDLYFSETTVENLALLSSGIESSFPIANLISDQVYYWKVITVDANGNTSDSGVYDFRVY